jgi:hypothetical protein
VEYWQGEGLELSQIREKIEEMKKEHKINQEELRHNKSLKDFWSS